MLVFLLNLCYNLLHNLNQVNLGGIFMSRITVKEALNMTTEEFKKMSVDLERSSADEVDKALEQFVRKLEEGKLSVNSNYKVSYLTIIILFSIMCIASFIGGILGSMEVYVAFPIVVLCLVGIFISAVTLRNLFK